MRKIVLISLFASLSIAAPAPHLLQQPSLSRNRIVFSYAGDLWTVPRSGGDATRLTTGVGIESNPVFSPDGSTIAFSGAYDGNIDVYTIPAAGGIPKRITYHPDPDFAVTWTPDGSHIVFTSTRDSNAGEAKLYSVPATGGLAEPLPLPLAFSGAFSPDGKSLLYTPTSGGSPFSFDRYVAWKSYRGGRANYLSIVNLKTLDSEKIPRQNSNDFNPMWIGDRIYFLSDRDGAVTLYRYDPSKKAGEPAHTQHRIRYPQRQCRPGRNRVRPVRRSLSVRPRCGKSEPHRRPDHRRHA